MKYIQNIIFIIFSLIIALFIVKNSKITEKYEDDESITNYQNKIDNNNQLKTNSDQNKIDEMQKIEENKTKNKENDKKLRKKNAKETDKSDEHLEKAQNFFKDVGNEWNRLFDIDFF